MRNQYILAFILLLVACTENNRRGLPDSTGKPYEVLIVAESVAAGKSVATLLATPVEALPQGNHNSTNRSAIVRNSMPCGNWHVTSSS